MVTSWRGGPRAVANPWRGADARVAGLLAAADLQLRPGPDGRRRPVRVRRPRRGARHLRAAAGAGGGRDADGRQRADTQRRASERGPEQMKEILVVANRTLGGAQAARPRCASARRPALCASAWWCPRASPRSGLVIYDEAVRESAQVRIDLALSAAGRRGHRGERRGRRRRPVPGDDGRDRASAARDEIIISTHPATHSGWLRRDLIERIHNASGLPVEHVVTDLEHEGLPFRVTLVVANRTSTGEELIEHLRQKAAHGGAPPVHRGRAPARTAAAPRRARRARASRRCSTAAARRRAAQLGHDRRPRPLHRGDERAGALQGRRRGHLDAAGRALGLAAREPDRACARRHASPVEHVVVDLQATATAAAPPRRARRARWRPPASPSRPPTRHRRRARAPRPAAGPPQLARRPPAARDAAFHHLRGDDLRGLLHGLLLHPRRPGRPVAGARHHTCRSGWRASTR